MKPAKFVFVDRNLLNELELDFEDEGLLIICQMTFLVFVPIAISIALIYLICKGAIPSVELNMWAVAALGAAIFQTTICFFEQKKILKNKITDMKYLYNIVYICIFFDVLTLSSFSVLFYQYLNIFQLSLTTLIFLFLGLGSMLTTFGFKRFSYSYLIPLYSVTFYYFGKFAFVGNTPIDFIYYFLIIVVCFLVSVISLSLYVSALIQESYALRYNENKINKELKKALKASELANQSKINFLASASHDLRQPVHALSLFCSILSMENLSDSAKKIAINIETSSKMLSTQLDALFDLSKIDLNELQVNFIPQNVKHFFEVLIVEYTLIAKDKNIDFLVSIPDHITTNTDVIQLERVVRNILNNAFKYTRSGSVNLNIIEQGNQYNLSVIDTGVGISEQDQSLIFDEFYQVGNDERDSKKGLGIGLAIVKRLCQKLNIDIKVKSVKGEGSTFSLTLPKVELDKKFTQINIEDNLRTENYRVLVIDDDPMALKAMQSTMELLGNDVYIADNQEEALEIISRHDIQILLVDYRLREKENGLNLIRIVKESKPMIQSIIVSADAHSQELVDAMESGIIVLSKPVRVEKLLSVIKRLEYVKDD